MKTTNQKTKAKEVTCTCEIAFTGMNDSCKACHPIATSAWTKNSNTPESDKMLRVEHEVQMSDGSLRTIMAICPMDAIKQVNDEQELSKMSACEKPRVNLREAMLTHPDYKATDPKRFRARYVNIAAITDDGRTISTQVWCASQQDIYEAEKVIVKWCLPDQEKWHGKIIFASMFDTRDKDLRTFARYGTMLKEVDITTAVLK